MPEINLPPDAASHSGWMKLLAAAGLPRVGSLGFSDNYLNDAMPPAEYNFDENGQQPLVSDGLSMKLVRPTEIEISSETDFNKKFWGVMGQPHRGITTTDLAAKR